MTMENLGRLEVRELLDLLDPKGSRVQSDLLAYLVQMEQPALEALQAQLENRAQLDPKASKGKLAPEAKLVQRAIEVSLVLKALLDQLGKQAQED